MFIHTQFVNTQCLFNNFGPEIDPENFQDLIQPEADQNRENREKLQSIL